MNPPTVKGRHKHHRRHDLPIDQCLQCGLAEARCRAKVRYESHVAANVEATARNEATGYEHMLTTYPCPWCKGFHLTRARRRSARWKRVERRRRRWLVQQRMSA